MTSDPNSPDGIDTEGKAVPPYDDRQESADVDDKDESTKDDVKTAGATGPVEDDDSKASEPEDTERGAVATPADEQPAGESGGAAGSEGSEGPAHHEGTKRAEDVP